MNFFCLLFFFMSLIDPSEAKDNESALILVLSPDSKEDVTLYKEMLTRENNKFYDIPANHIHSLTENANMEEYRAQLRIGLEQIKEKNNPVMHLLISSHGKPGELCQHNRPNIPLKEVVKKK